MIRVLVAAVLILFGSAHAAFDPDNECKQFTLVRGTAFLDAGCNVGDIGCSYEVCYGITSGNGLCTNADTKYINFSYNGSSSSMSCSGIRRYCAGSADQIVYTDPPVYPECTDPKVIDYDDCSCQCPDGSQDDGQGGCEPLDSDDDGTPDACDTDAPSYDYYDCDGDDTPNWQDDDDNNDGLPDANDPDHPEYDPTDPNSDPDQDGETNENDDDDDGDGVDDDVDTSPYDASISDHKGDCLGRDALVYTDYGTVDQRYLIAYGISQTTGGCSAHLQNINIVGVRAYDDQMPTCEAEYCYVNLVKFDCDSYDYTQFQPDGYQYKPDYNEYQCEALIGDDYTAYSYIVPNSTECSSLGYCFVLPNDAPDDPDAPIDDNPQLDGNSSQVMTDLAPLLDAQNIGNDIAKQTNKKLDQANSTLESINKHMENQVGVSQGIKDAINDMPLNEINSNLKEGFSDLKTVLNDSSNSLNHMDHSLNNIEDSSASSASTLSQMLDWLIDGLSIDLDPFEDLSDGSEGFGDLQTEVGSSFSTFSITDPLGLNSYTASTIDPISFSLWGKTFTLLDSSMLSSLPLEDIRSLFLFVAALGGIFVVFRTI